MNILVTGGAGFIGSHVVDALIDRGDRVVVLDNLATRVHPEGMWPSYLHQDARRIRGDVSEREDWVAALDDIDAVVHLAAYQDYQLDFSRFARVNDMGTALLYEVLVETGQPLTRVVVASSQAVYGEGAYQCTEHGRQHPGLRSSDQLRKAQWNIGCSVCGIVMEPVAAREEHVAPTNAYAVSKLATESYALALGGRYDVPTTALRFSIIQGPRQSPANAYSGVLRSFVGHVQRGRSPVIFEDGCQLRDYTHIRDAVSAVLIALGDSGAVGQAFNVGSGEITSVLEYARVVLDVMGVESSLDANGRYRVGDTRHVWSDTERLRAIGWQPTGTLAEIVRDYVSWFKKLDQSADWAARALERMEASGTVRQASVGGT